MSKIFLIFFPYAAKKRRNSQSTINIYISKKKLSNVVVDHVDLIHVEGRKGNVQNKGVNAKANFTDHFLTKKMTTFFHLKGKFPERFFSRLNRVSHYRIVFFFSSPSSSLFFLYLPSPHFSSSSSFFCLEARSRLLIRAARFVHSRLFFLPRVPCCGC